MLAVFNMMAGLQKQAASTFFFFSLRLIWKLHRCGTVACYVTMALLYGANRWEFNSWKLWLMALWAYFLHLISDWIQTSTGKENHNNKAHSSVMCHRFAKKPAGCWCPGQVKLFIRGKLPKQTQQPGADISVAVGNESEGRDGDRVGERASPHWTYVYPCQYRWWWWVVGGWEGPLLSEDTPLYVCPLAWAPVRSFLMISFTAEKKRRVFRQAPNQCEAFTIQFKN